MPWSQMLLRLFEQVIRSSNLMLAEEILEPFELAPGGAVQLTLKVLP
ncbi:MAG: hypothetical protein ACE5JI_17325 [Acidobacteriota bacterium]